mgnify:CR=1 FL=1
MRARARRAAMRRLGARGGAARARSASLALAAATLACLWSADAFSIGIDLGSESTTVAASRSGGSARDVSVVPDDRGGRSSPSLVGFTEKHAARVFGADAESLRATCPRCVFSDPRSLMAVPLSALRDAASGGRGYPREYASLDRSTASAFAEDPARGTARVPFPPALAARAEAEMDSWSEGEGDAEKKRDDTSDDGGFFFHPETLAAMLVEDAALRAARALDDGKTSSETSSSSSSFSFKKMDTAALAVPGWWTQHQRAAFLDAAAVAGFPKNKTTLVSETAAASAALAIRFSDEWNKEAQNGRGRKNEGREPNKSLVVALVGVGARSAWASAVRFSADRAFDSEYASKKSPKKRHLSDARIRVRVEVLQQEWEDGDGGGWALDDAVAAAAVRLGKRYQEFGGTGEEKKDANVSETKASDETEREMKRLASAVSDHPRSVVRLAVASRRAKEVLSANAEATLDVLGFFPDGSDLVAEIKREDVFGSPDGVRSVAAATAPLRRLLSRRGGAIDAVELLGGGARVPAVQAAVAAIVAESASSSAKENDSAEARKNKKTSTGSIPIHTRLNLEEAVAVGAATVAANATMRAESLALRLEAKALAKKKGKANAQRARAADADAAAAARAIRENPTMTDAFPHFVRLFIRRSDSEGESPGAATKPIVSPEDFVTVFRPGAGVPSRRAVDLSLVRSGFEVALVESARNASRGRGSHPGAEFSSEEFSPKPGLGSALPPAFLSPPDSSSSSSSRRELPFARFRVDGVEANIEAAFESVGVTRTKGTTARVTLHFALDRGGGVVLEKATSITEVPAGGSASKKTVVEGALFVTETTTSASTPAPLETEKSYKLKTQPPRRSDAELARERRTLRWLRARDSARAAADAALSALEGDALQTRDRLERFEERARKKVARKTNTETETETPPEARELENGKNSAEILSTRKSLRSALTKALDAADDALVVFSATDITPSDAFDVAREIPEEHFVHEAWKQNNTTGTTFDAKRTLSVTRRLRRELADAADAFFGKNDFSLEDEDEEEEDVEARDRDAFDQGSARVGRSRETDDARALVLELEDRIAELERDLEACRRGERAFGERVEL